VPELKDGQALARVNISLSIPQCASGWSRIPTSHCADGEVMRAIGFAEIVESRHPDTKKGDRVTGLTGLSRTTSSSTRPRRALPKVAEDSLRLGHRLAQACSAPTGSLFFCMEISAPKKGRNARRLRPPPGATGSIAGQIGNSRLPRRGIAGTDDKWPGSPRTRASTLLSTTSNRTGRKACRRPLQWYRH